MNYAQTLDYLYQRLPTFHRIGGAAYKPGLDNIRNLLAYLGNPETAFKAVHVAGTNGKGSSSHALAAVLQSAGYRTGLYTSPHLKDFSERIRVNGQPIAESEVVNFVQRHRDFIESSELSFFELAVGMAFAHFAEQGVEIAVIEVGLGGRLDATNVIRPEVALITQISFDHAQYLGNALPEIAGEKAGIIKPGITVVIGQRQTAVEHVFIEKARQEGSRLQFADELYQIQPVAETVEGWQLNVTRPEGASLSNLLFGLNGAYQLTNLPGILAACAVLEEWGWAIPTSALSQGLAHVRTLTGLKGRWQKLGENPLVIADGAHNEGGLRAVIASLQNLTFGHLHWVIGVVNDKDLATLLPLLPPEATYYFTQPPTERALPAQALRQAAADYELSGETYPDVHQALAAARSRATPQDLILIAGSLFLIAEVV